MAKEMALSDMRNKFAFAPQQPARIGGVPTPPMPPVK